jgi:hypothetical protein
MADYRKIVSIYKNKNKGFSYQMGFSVSFYYPLNCDLGTSVNPILGSVKNNTSYGINWFEFDFYKNELGYDATCENFKNMPSTIYNVIFKKVFWDSIQGDKINNQGIANILVERRGLSLMIVFEALKKLGYVRPYTSVTSTSLSNSLSFSLIDEDVAFINKLDADGKSYLLFDELTKELPKDKLYWISKMYVLKTSEKIALGVGVLFVSYLVYKIIKR